MSILETVDFGRTVLESLGYTVRGNRVFIISADGEEEVEVDGKTLVLPDDSFLRAPKWETEIPFGPLGENPQRGESEVVKMVLEAVVANLNVSLLGIMIHLYTNVAMMPDTKTLTTEQAALLPFIVAVNDKVKKAILGLVKVIDCEDQGTSLLTCNLRRRCPLGDTKFERVCVVRFPFADMERKEKPWGLNSTAEFDTLRGLMDFVLPGWEVDDTYSVGTNTFVAPYFTSVMMMYGKVASRLNEVINMYKDVAPALLSYQAPGVERVVELINRPGYLEKLRDAMPALDGNKGSTDAVRPPVADYKIDQPKPAVDLPWNHGVDDVANEAQQRQNEDQGSGGSYKPGLVKPQPQQQVQSLQLQPLGGPSANYDPNSFHGRQMAKQALLQPLAAQQALHGPVGGSPFLESNEPKSAGGTYRPGALHRAQQEQAQRQQQHHQTPIGNGSLGF